MKVPRSGRTRYMSQAPAGCAWLQAGDLDSTARIAISRCRSKYG